MVPCGRERSNFRPTCALPCVRPPYCRHPTSIPHLCHEGQCPQCIQTCGQPRVCGHPCPAPCHDQRRPDVPPASVRRSNSSSTGGGSGKRQDPSLSSPSVAPPPLPTVCPPCMVPVVVVCDGKHEQRTVPCHERQPYRCLQPCGRMLECGRHECPRGCHTVPEDGCGPCTAKCDRARPPMCTHSCPRICHADACPPCEQMLRRTCHCSSLNMLLVCAEFVVASEARRAEMLSCRGRCPKIISCGHACALDCHAGLCTDPSQCKKKIVLRCPCKRLKKVYLTIHFVDWFD